MFFGFGKLRWDAWFIAVLCVWVAQFVFVYSILGDVDDILDAWGVSGQLFGPFRMSWASLGGLGAALGSHLQSEEKKLQKMIVGGCRLKNISCND